MLNKKILVLAGTAIFAFFGGALYAATEEVELPNPVKPIEKMTLTLEQALDCAVENSRQLKTAKIDLEIAERSKKYRWNVFIPTIKGMFTAARTTDIDSTLQQLNGSGKMTDMIKGLHASDPTAAPILSMIPASSTVEATEKAHWALTGDISASLNLSLAYIGKIRVAVKSYEIGEITWENAVRDLKRSVTEMFYQILLVQEKQKIDETSLENARQRARQAEISYRNGSIPEIQLLQAQVNYQNQIPTVESSRVTLTQLLETFAFLIGLPNNQKIELDGKIEPVFVNVTFDELMSKYAENNTQIVLLRKGIEAKKHGKAAADLGIFSPALSLNYNYNPVLALIKDDGKWADGGRFSATLVWTISDMLPFSDKKIESKKLADEIKKDEINLEQLIQKNELDIRSALDSLDSLKKNIETSQRNIKLAQKSYEMYTDQYRSGQAEYLSWKEAETQYNQSKLGLLNAQFDYMKQVMDLEHTLNTTLR